MKLSCLLMYATLFVIIVTVSLGGVDALRVVDENPCVRSCESSVPMTCVYNWTVTWYYAMSSQCGDCPTNRTACSNPGCVSVDGVPRAVTVINYAFPGPSIQICSGDEVVVNVNNQMPNSEGLTIHWHGILHHGSQWMDGVPMITQCPIPSPGMFQYRFAPSERGTHWYHAHTGLHRGDGVAGTFVIREPRRTDPNAALYDEDLPEHVIFLNDWHHDVMIEVFERQSWTEHSHPDDAILINGKGIPMSGSPPFVPLEVFNVQQGIKYRFRVINGANFACNFQVSVEDHSLLVIASDGSALEPQAVDYFRINGGERYDFVLDANQTVGNYEVRVAVLESCGTFSDGTVGRQIAHLHYDTAPAPVDPASLPSIAREGTQDIYWKTFPNKSLAEINSNLDSDAVFKSTNGTPDAQYYIETSMHDRESTIPHQGTSTAFLPLLNNISYYFPTSPVMSQLDDLPASLFCNQSSFAPGACDGPTPCACVHTINVDLNTLVEIVLVDPDSIHALHPMHLHGMDYRVIAMERIKGATVESVRELDRNGSITRNLNGPLKDTVVIPDGGYTIFRFRAWNPGWWIFHCHIEFHLQDGMALLFRVGGPTPDLPPLPTGFPTCGVFPPSTDSAVPENPTSTRSMDVLYLIMIIPGAFMVGVMTVCCCDHQRVNRKCTAVRLPAKTWRRTQDFVIKGAVLKLDGIKNATRTLQISRET